MKFIVDAQLPRYLSELLLLKGHDSIHTLDLSSQNKTRDNKIINISIDESRIVRAVGSNGIVRMDFSPSKST